MNYFEWAQEYYASAKDLQKTIEKLKAKREKASISDREELDRTIAQYKIYQNDCLSTANILMNRHRGEG